MRPSTRVPRSRTIGRYRPCPDAPPAIDEAVFGLSSFGGHSPHASQLLLVVIGLLGAAVAASAAVATESQSSVKIIGSATAGKSTFVTTCGSCHTLKAAKTAGAIGPNLDKVKPTEAKIITAISKGGASIMTKAAVAKYPTQMVAYKGTLSTKQIDNVAAFVYVSTHPTAK